MFRAHVLTDLRAVSSRSFDVFVPGVLAIAVGGLMIMIAAFPISFRYAGTKNIAADSRTAQMPRMLAVGVLFCQNRSWEFLCLSAQRPSVARIAFDILLHTNAGRGSQIPAQPDCDPRNYFVSL
jgi:hypothetical protein